MREARSATFSYDVVRQESQVVVWLSGELDRASAPELSHCLDRLVCGTSTEAVLDLSQLTFCDAAGLGIFERYHERVAARGARFVLRAPSPSVRRLLALMRLERLLDGPAP